MRKVTKKVDKGKPVKKQKFYEKNGIKQLDFFNGNVKIVSNETDKESVIENGITYYSLKHISDKLKIGTRTVQVHYVSAGLIPKRMLRRIGITLYLSEDVISLIEKKRQIQIKKRDKNLIEARKDKTLNI